MIVIAALLRILFFLAILGLIVKGLRKLLSGPQSGPSSPQTGPNKDTFEAEYEVLDQKDP